MDLFLIVGIRGLSFKSLGFCFTLFMMLLGGVLKYTFRISFRPLKKSRMVLLRRNPPPIEIIKLSFFSSRIILKSYDDFYMIIVGLEFDHFLTSLISDMLKEQDVEYEIFSIKSSFIRNIAYHDLYDFNSKKWALTPMN